MVLSMERWVGKVAIVTGASAGIGAAIVVQLVEHGMIVAGLARRNDKIQELAAQLKNAPGQLHALKCDVSREEDILRSFKWVEDNLGPVQVLINNAGLLSATNLADGETAAWKELLDVNVMGLCIATREAIRSIKKRRTDGHIIQMNSIVGHMVPSGKWANLNIYPATKHAVTALCEVLRYELLEYDGVIKVTSVSPGVTKTNIFEQSDVTNLDLDQMVTNKEALKSEDIADAIVYALSTPIHVQIKELTIKAVKERF